MPIVRTIVFVSIMTAAMVGLHYYVYLRVTRGLALGPSEQRILKAVLTALFALLWLSFPLTRLVSRSAALPFMWVGYIWMGTIVLSSVVFGLFDLSRFVAGLLSPAVPIDESRRALIGRLFDVAALGGATLVSGCAVALGLRPVVVKRIEVALKKLPAELSGFQIVQLTDVHIGPTLDGKWLTQVVEQVNAQNPDAIVITGDLVDGSVAQLGQHVAPLANLRARHGVFFVTGNHEYYSGVDSWLAELSRLGIRVLRNEHITLRPSKLAGEGASDLGIDLVGVDDFHADVFPGHGPDLPRAVKGRDPSRPAVLLAHQPAAVMEAAQHGIDLQLSGHTHAGQMWPWGYFVRLQQPYVYGLHKHGDTQIYVSAGTGYWGPPMRLASEAEITCVILSRAG
ncbi:MAG TPA: metallophosphoesterase [Pseudomonadota bacterium]|nr:metallophosphoesterase [Pseudomonadota bacterium]HNK43657.1 metallophosphoesterase [Pseudomonadota bacterium]HNN53096.1 metallophosphoesterase [Pseudomonadota bacterium]HNO69354.1 metallophosphoesterase [Pseudomonadota bacterium]